MPEFQFRYTNTQALPSKLRVTAKNLTEAFKKKEAFLEKFGGKYTVGSMQEFKVTSWHKVKEPETA